MTQKAPERIWAEFGYDMRRGAFWDEPSDQSIEYLHIDHALALAAEEREACAKICDAEMERLEPDKAEGYGAGLYDQSIGLASDIRARTDDDTQAALDRLLQEARNEALREAADKVVPFDDETMSCRNVILSLITEDQSDE